MKIILNDFVEKLGERGTVVEVKPGYARNYLLPRGLAYVYSDGNLRRFEQEQKRWEELELKRQSAAHAAMDDVDGTELLFERRAGETDTLFGSVSTQDIARRLAEKGLTVDKRRVQLPDPIKALGSFDVPIQLHRDIVATIKVHVVRPGESAPTAEPVEPAEAETAEAASEVAG
jgi:large subunit ribosomal protein L9